MPTYEAYNLHIDSEVPLVGLADAAGAADVIVRQRSLPSEELQSLVTDDQLCWGNVHGLVVFVVRDGAEIIVDPRDSGISEELIGSFVTGILMAILLRQRGFFTLHASCVAKDGAAVAFAGMSGCGKSTLAEYFRQRGYQVLCDDLLALQMGEVPLVIPGYPHIRLTHETGTRFVEEFDSLRQLSSHRGKRLRTLSEMATEPISLQRLYLLDTDSAPKTVVEHLAFREAFSEIPHHVWATNTIADLQSKTKYLQQCATLINIAPVARLRRVRTLDALGEHFEAVEQDLATALNDIRA